MTKDDYIRVLRTALRLGGAKCTGFEYPQPDQNTGTPSAILWEVNELPIRISPRDMRKVKSGGLSNNVYAAMRAHRDATWAEHWRRKERAKKEAARG